MTRPKRPTETRREVYLPDPLPHQVPILESPARFKVLACGRRFGKSTIGLRAVLAGWPGAKGALQGGTAWLVAPTFGVASDAWRALKAATLEVTVEKLEVERRVELVGGGAVVVKSADEPGLLRGTGLDLVVIDEAAHTAKLEELWAEVLRPALADKRGAALFLSTPRGRDNYFHTLFKLGETAREDGWASWSLPTRANPLIDQGEIEAARKQLGSLVFSQEFEAEFVAPGAGLFKPEWLKRRYTLAGDVVRLWDGLLVPLGALTRFAAVDLAVSVKSSADWTACVVLGVTPDGRALVLDVLRARLEAPDIVPALARLCTTWHACVLGVERVAFQLAIVQEGRRKNLPVRELTPRGDKVARALPVAAALEGGRILLPDAAPWVSELEAELLSFPAGRWDDQTDALGYAWELARAHAGAAWWAPSGSRDGWPTTREPREPRGPFVDLVPGSGNMLARELAPGGLW